MAKDTCGQQHARNSAKADRGQGRLPQRASNDRGERAANHCIDDGDRRGRRQELLPAKLEQADGSMGPS